MEDTRSFAKKRPLEETEGEPEDAQAKKAKTDGGLPEVVPIAPMSGPVAGAPFDASKREKDEGVEFRALIESHQVGSVIGRGGCNARRVRNECNVYCSVLPVRDPKAVRDRVLTVKGAQDNIARAFEILADVLAQAAAEAEEKGFTNKHERGQTTMRLLVHATTAGAIIGKGGTIVREIMDATGARVSLSTEPLPESTDKTVSVTGTPRQIHDAFLRIIRQVSENPTRAHVRNIPFDPQTQVAPSMPPYAPMSLGMGHAHPHAHAHDAAAYGGYPAPPAHAHGPGAGPVDAYGAAVGGWPGVPSPYAQPPAAPGYPHPYYAAAAHPQPPYGYPPQQQQQQQQAQVQPAYAYGGHSAEGVQAQTQASAGSVGPDPASAGALPSPSPLPSVMGPLGGASVPYMAPPIRIAAPAQQHGAAGAGAGAGPGHMSLASAPGEPPKQRQDLWIPSASAGAVIGSRGSIIQHIKQQSGCTMHIEDSDPNNRPDERLVIVVGQAHGVQLAVQLIRYAVENNGLPGFGPGPAMGGGGRGRGRGRSMGQDLTPMPGSALAYATQ